MAKAFKCDRCKKFYESTQDGYEFEIWDCKNHNRSLDLCPECHNNLKNWLHALEPPKEWSGDLLDDWGIIKAQESEEKNG